MQIIKLDATDSTNTHLKRMVANGSVEDFTVVIADEQLQGRGQMGTRWQSETGKNLTFSVLKKNLNLSIADQFHLNICVSLAIYNTLRGFQVPDLSIKWPNDILSGTSKICGILIENILSGSEIKTSVIGIGLNVNQLAFGDLQNVSSLKLLLGKTFNLDELLHKISSDLSAFFSQLEEKHSQDLFAAYEKILFRKDKPSTFEHKTGKLFTGIIKGVSPEGKLRITLEDAIIKEFDLKEIKLRY